MHFYCVSGGFGLINSLLSLRLVFFALLAPLRSRLLIEPHDLAAGEIHAPTVGRVALIRRTTPTIERVEVLGEDVFSTIAIVAGKGDDWDENALEIQSSSRLVEAHVCTFQRVRQEVEVFACVSIAVVEPDAEDLTCGRSQHWGFMVMDGVHTYHALESQESREHTSDLRTVAVVLGRA